MIGALKTTCKHLRFVNAGAGSKSARKGTAKEASRPLSAQPPTATSFSGARVIVMGIGGVTWSEVRAMYELMRTHGREVVVGGTSLLNAKDYLAEVEALSRG